MSHSQQLYTAALLLKRLQVQNQLTPTVPQPGATYATGGPTRPRSAGSTTVSRSYETSNQAARRSNQQAATSANQAEINATLAQYNAAAHPMLKARLRGKLDNLGWLPAPPVVTRPVTLPTPITVAPVAPLNPRPVVPQPNLPAITPSPRPPIPGPIASPAPWSPPSVVPAGLTPTQFAQIKANGASSFLPSPLGDQLVPLTAPATVPRPITPNRAAVGLPALPDATAYEPKAVPPVPTFDGAKLASGIGDVARLAAGIGLGSQKVENPSIPQRWLDYAGQVDQRANQGLTAPEMGQAKNQIANNYGQGVNTLTELTGGGSAPGTVLAGLTNLGLQRGQQTQNLLTSDAARRQANFTQFGQVTGQTASMEQGIQNNLIARQAATQQLGANLVGATLQNRENRSIFEQNQPLYTKLLQGQVSAQQEAVDTQKAIKAYYAKLATLPSDSPFWSSRPQSD